MTKKWSEENIVILKDNYPTLGPNIKELLGKGLTKNAIRSKASILGVKKLPLKILYSKEDERKICTYLIKRCSSFGWNYRRAVKDIRDLGVSEHSDRSISFKLGNYRYLHTGKGCRGGCGPKVRRIYGEVKSCIEKGYL